MRIKKYVAKSMREALLQIKEELGEDAIILKTRKIQKKMFGLAGPDEIEVTAAIDDEAALKNTSFPPLHVNKPGVYNRPRTQNAKTPPKPSVPPPAVPEVRPYFPPKQRTSAPVQNQLQRPDHQPPKEKEKADEILELKEDVRELKNLVKSILSTGAVNAGTAVKNEAAPPVTEEGWAALTQRLVDSEVKQNIAEKLIDSIRESAVVTEADLESTLISSLSSEFPVSGPLKLKKNRPVVVAFVGPTGSGKTTTLAKLAAHCCLNKSRKISIITADTYRIAAIEQIRMFADIVKVGLQVVFSPEEVPAALENCSESDVVFVDTAGRSQRNSEHMEELKTLVSTLKPDETHLVLSATTKDSDLEEMIRLYKTVKVNRLLFTKLDETTKLGSIFNVVSKENIPVSYFTVGQSVPDDIELAKSARFVQTLIKGRSR
ncbi:MAG: flagellar biosynthesis protein FlhF [Chitinispirillaceae bacterium]